MNSLTNPPARTASPFNTRIAAAVPNIISLNLYLEVRAMSISCVLSPISAMNSVKNTFKNNNICLLLLSSTSDFLPIHRWPPDTPMFPHLPMPVCRNRSPLLCRSHRHTYPEFLLPADYSCHQMLYPLHDKHRADIFHS